MHETPDDLSALQELIDRSYATAGPHLLRIHTPDRRLTAEHQIETVGAKLRAMMPWIAKNKLVDQSKN